MDNIEGFIREDKIAEFDQDIFIHEFEAPDEIMNSNFLSK